jgi:hypothetical protein
MIVRRKKPEDFILLDRVTLWLWTVRWKLRGHARNHDSQFCSHKPKVWTWEMDDGCRGGLCEWCHILEFWAPSTLPDVKRLTRTYPDGTPDNEWASLIFRDLLEDIPELRDRGASSSSSEEPSESPARRFPLNLRPILRPSRPLRAACTSPRDRAIE